MMKFIINGQQLRLVTSTIVAGTLNYLSAQASFKGEEWNGLIKYAHFVKGNVDHPFPFQRDELRNLNLSAGTWQVYITGSAIDPISKELTVRITTSTVHFRVEPTELANPFPPVTPEFSEILAAEISRAQDTAQGVKDAADSGEYNGATFTPHIKNGVLSWTNDRELPNPPEFTVKGEKGKDGRNFCVLGYFSSAEELNELVSNPSAGNTYGVGTGAPYDMYVWDAVHDSWVNIGPVQGVKGDDGAQGEKGEDGEDGHTPIKGEDYFTEDDINDVISNISAGSIDAIENPSSKTEGQFLKYTDEGWIAANVESGVASVDGKSGDVVTRLVRGNISVPIASWNSTGSDPAHPWRADLQCSTISGLQDLLAEVYFSPTDAKSGNFSSTADIYLPAVGENDYLIGVSIYARRKPSKAIQIPLVAVHLLGNRGGNEATQIYMGRTNAEHAAQTVYEATLTAADWTAGNNGGYEQTVEVEGLLAEDKPIADIMLSEDMEEAELELEEWQKICGMSTEDGTLKARAFEAPGRDLTIRLKAVR